MYDRKNPGTAMGMLGLGERYLDGSEDGVVNLEMAIYWLTKAAKEGVGTAVEKAADSALYSCKNLAKRKVPKEPMY